MPQTTENKDVDYNPQKPWEPLTGPYAASARRAQQGKLEWDGVQGGAEPAPNGEEGSGARIPALGRAVGTRVNLKGFK